MPQALRGLPSPRDYIRGGRRHQLGCGEPSLYLFDGRKRSGVPVARVAPIGRPFADVSNRGGRGAAELLGEIRICLLELRQQLSKLPDHAENGFLNLHHALILLSHGTRATPILSPASEDSLSRPAVPRHIVALHPLNGVRIESVAETLPHRGERRCANPWYLIRGAVLVEIVAMPDCPYLPGTRLRLEEALEHLALRVSWREYVLGKDTAPSYTWGAPSPTIFIDGLAVGGDEEMARVYRGVRLRRVTPFGTLLQMLQRATEAAKECDSPHP